MNRQITAAELGRKINSREISVREVADAYFDAIEAHDRELGAFITVCRDVASSSIDAAQKAVDAGQGGPLTGVPIALKDNISTDGIATSCASKILEGYVPPYDATVVRKLKESGLILAGKTNLDEFAMGTSTENSAYFVARNPWNTTLIPGGSSGGSAVAVSAGMSPLSLGSDTGGSIRQPAALCGVVGFKPTYGRVSRYGLVAFGSSLDQIGPFGATVEDVALISEVISGHDALDSTSIPDSVIKSKGLKDGSLKGKRVAIPMELITDANEPGVLKQVFAAIDKLKAEGVEFEEVSVPEIKQGVTTYYIIAPAEASSNLARFDGLRYGARLDAAGHEGIVSRTRGELFGHEVKQRIMVGTYVLSAGYYDAFYVRAQKVRAKMAAAFEVLYKEFDAVLSPTSPVVAFPIGAKSGDPLAMKLLDYCTIPANMGGFPAISLPCGLSEGLPVGLQLMGNVNQDESLLQLAYCVERALGTEPQWPTLN